MTKAEKMALPKPLMLRAMLARRGIRHEDVVATLRAANGRPIHRSTFGRWINGARDMRNTPVELLREQVTKFLRDEHVSEAEIATAFDTDAVSKVYSVGRSAVPAAPQPDIEIKLENEMLTQRARQHFRLPAEPFPKDVTPGAEVYMNEDFLYVKNAMIQCAKTAGLLAVIGQSGSGKSVMRKEFRHEINERHKDVRVINVEAFDKARLNASALCEAIVQDLKPGTIMRSSLEGRARQVRDVLEQSHNAGQKHVMLIEEAHDVPVTTLKFMKRFWEMESGGTTRMLAIVLIGQTEMAHKLDLRQNWQAREFINRCEVAELAPLDAHLKNYIAHKFKLIGVDVTKVIAEDAYAAIHGVLVEKTQNGTRNGLQPLRVQVLLTKAFNKAAQVGAQQITAEIIRGV